MTSIDSTIPVLDDVSDSFLHSDTEYVANANNALTYLIHQQGHTVDELLEKVYENPPKIESQEALVETKGRNEDFIQSVADEINGNYGGMTELTALTSASGEKLINLLESIAKGEDYIILQKETEIGLFNEWSGAGSSLEITPEKDIVIPANMVRNIQFESSYEDRVASNDGYSVDEVYGLIGSVWKKSSADITKEEPVLRQENMKDVQNKLIEYKEDWKKKNSKENLENKKEHGNVER